VIAIRLTDGSGADAGFALHFENENRGNTGDVCLLKIVSDASGLFAQGAAPHRDLRELADGEHLLRAGQIMVAPDPGRGQIRIRFTRMDKAYSFAVAQEAFRAAAAQVVGS
jgi:hypothetical protein